MMLLSRFFDTKVKLKIENVTFDRIVQEELLKNVHYIKNMNNSRIYGKWWGGIK